MVEYGRYVKIANTEIKSKKKKCDLMDFDNFRRFSFDFTS